MSILLRLNYLKPTTSPHGLFGALELFFGMILLRDAMTGKLDRFQNGSFILPLYWITSLIMAVGALRIVNQAPKKFKFLFKWSAVLHITLIYYMYRFSCYHWNGTDSLDFIMGPLFLCTASCLAVYTFKEINIFASMMYCSLFTVAGYVVPVTIYGQSYIDCLDEEWPMQSVGFVSYVFGAISTIYSLCLFLVTVITRIGLNKIPIVFSIAVLVVPVIATLVGAVLMQEIVIPWVSTQRLIIFCPRPKSLSFEDYVESAFNLSTLAQTTLQFGGYSFH